MYKCVAKDQLHPRLLGSLEQGFVKTVRFDGKSYCHEGQRYRGIHSAIERRYYPLQWRIKSRHYNTKKRGSSRAQGKAVERAIDRHVFEGKTLRQRMAKAVIATWRAMNHEVQAAQWPVLLWRKNICTQVDYLTQDMETGELWMWELKTGWPVCPRSPKRFRNLPERMPCTPFTRWDMQRAMTHWALVNDANIPIAASRIIHVWEQKERASPWEKGETWRAKVKVMEPIDWVEKYKHEIYKGL